MCFSAPASFTASASLLVIGVIAIHKSTTTPQRIFAGIPILFAAQQFCEGLLWLALSVPAYAHFYHASMYIFLAFAQIVWPSYVPLFVLLLESEAKRKKILRILLAVGICTSIYFFYCLLAYPVSGAVEGHHIKYYLDFPFGNQWFSGISYIIAAVFAPFISSLKYLKFVGVLLLASYIITQIFYKDYLISVWCYFAAILSLTVLALIMHLRKQSVNT